MPGPFKSLVVVAAIEGLILHPPGQRNQRNLQIKYKTQEILPAGCSALPGSPASAEVHGIVGLLTLAPVSYLIAILRREQVAQIRGVPIFVITDVALIPLSSQYDAKKAIDQAKESLNKGGQSTSRGDSDTSDDEEVHTEDDQAKKHDDVAPVSSESPTSKENSKARPGGPERSTSNVVEDVISRKGQYGQFAERWFSRKGWSTDRRRAQGMSSNDAEKPPSSSTQNNALQDDKSMPKDEPNALKTGQAPDPIPKAEATQKLGKSAESDNTSTSVANTLLPKLLRTTRLLLGSRSFFFSYDLDITRRLGNQGSRTSELPLYKSVDPLYFWNSHLSQPLIAGGHHAIVLPLMQGFVGQRAFTLKKKNEDPSKAVSTAEQDTMEAIRAQDKAESAGSDSNFLLTLISRRSVKRPGLRYLRRGVDDEGNTANSVETEQILSKASWAPSEKVHSFTQIRGSIPLFFSQSPYSFKPVPVLQHSPEVTQRAFRRHFTNITNRYGDIQIALLVDKKGGEAEIGRRYEESTTKLNSEDGIVGKTLGFEWFDFHAVCRGMKFENVSLLMDSLGGKLDGFGETVEVDGKLSRKQSGVLRTNCMDCLDRTNVVQSACAQRALEMQLKEEGVEVDLLTDTTTQWFNTLWADNGDAISRQYANTAALKGDYTRTRQRNYRGAINDLGLTLSRYYNNIVNDYFSQAAIDYLLGNVTSQIFDEFEATLENRDPAMSMAKVRANAVDTSSKIVIADQSESLVGGWTLISPREPNTVRTNPFEEICLLVTDVALYRVNFDWNVEKVSSFERVDLRSVVGIIKGTYITSTLTATQTDPERNVGFVVKYKPGKEDVARVNTRSLSSAVGLDGSKACDLESASKQSSKKSDESGIKVVAFKALPARDSFTSMEGQETQTMNEKELISSICEEIRRGALGENKGTTDFMEDREIISLAEAKKSTGLIEQWGHSIKKMVWA